MDAARETDPLLLAYLERLVEHLLGYAQRPDLDAPPRDARTSLFARVTDAAEPCLWFAEQFILDVSAVKDEQRRVVTESLGVDAFTFVQLLYVADYHYRLTRVWSQIFGITASTGSVAGRPSLWDSLQSLFSTVARMQQLDPLMTELVRLRGARAHKCRLCQSLRSVRAVELGATEETYRSLDQFEASDLPDEAKIALRLTDAILWRPARYPADLTSQVVGALSPSEIVELAFDVMRNAANKIAVALGADEAHVSDGVELYDIDDRGEVVYQASAPSQ
jgi:alkylhydroperoxidase family enzyme